MPVDANGTPSAKLGIYKYNTAGDAPSGKGLNNIVDSLDDIISRLGISGLVANDVPVYDSVAGKWKKASGTPSSAVYLRGDGSWQSIAPAAITGYPSDATKFLRGDGAWQALAGPTSIIKVTTPKNVGNSAVQTDLFNGAVTLPALTATSLVRIKAWGTMVNTTGAAQNLPTFQVILNSIGMAAISGSTGAVWNSGGGQVGWFIDVAFNNLGATNSQFQNMEFRSTIAGGGGASTNSAGGFTYAPTALGGVSTVYGQAAGTYAIDTSVARLLQLGVTNPVANVNYATALEGALIEVF